MISPVMLRAILALNNGRTVEARHGCIYATEGTVKALVRGLYIERHGGHWCLTERGICVAAGAKAAVIKDAMRSPSP